MDRRDGSDAADPNAGCGWVSRALPVRVRLQVDGLKASVACQPGRSD